MPPIEAVAAPEVKDKAVVGFIYPPPEVRNIVDKTANFVARNGPEFEARIRQNEQNNPKFNFLNPGDPYHAYYQHKVNECRSGKSGDKEVPQRDLSISGLSRLPTTVSSVSVAQQQKQQELLRSAVLEATVPKEPPPDFEFIADPPSISAFDLDVVRLTAQFVARNGRQFLTTLMNREQRNNQFDFLRPQHSLFQYFTRLLEQYTKVLIPPKDLMKRLADESASAPSVMKQVRVRVDWERHQAAVRRKEEEEAERERLEYAAIDWHDFSVVETIDYQPWEVGTFPPPTTPNEVGRRVLLQERIDDGVVPEDNMVLGSDDEDEEEPEEPQGAPGERDDTQVQDMEEESSSEEDSDEEDSDKDDDGPPGVSVSAAKDAQQMKPPAPPLPKEPPQPTPAPPVPGQVVVREYNPRQRPGAQATAPSDQYLVSPITGERISADKVSQHLRINMLDPRWLEDRDRQLAEKSKEENVFAAGDSIKTSLRMLAERRTDIFGAGDEETGIGKKIGEEEKREEKVTWDGHTGSMEAATRAARANISINEQIHQIHKVKGLLPDQEKEKIGPQPIKSSSERGQDSQPTSRPNIVVPPQKPQPPAPPKPQPPPPPPKSVPQPTPAPPPPPKPTPAPAPPPPMQQQQPPAPPRPQGMMMVQGGPMPSMAPMMPGPPGTGPMVMVPGRPATTMMVRPGFMPGPPGQMPSFMPQPPGTGPPGGPQHGMGPPGAPIGPPGVVPAPPGPPAPPGIAPPIPGVAPSRPDDDDEGPAAKKPRTEESLVAEAEWARRFPGPVKFLVTVPMVGDKPEFKLLGQTLTLTLPLTDPVSVVKSKVHESTGVPPGKQKLAKEGMFFKDSMSLAFYNVGNGTTIQLQLKERGGRKK